MVSSLHKIKGGTEKTLYNGLPKEIKAALDPFEGIQIKETEIQRKAQEIEELDKTIEENTGAPNNSFLPNSLQICFRLFGVLLKFCMCYLSGAIIFLSVRSS